METANPDNFLQGLLAQTADMASFSFSKVRAAILGSCDKEEESVLPKTGMPEVVEKEFSSIFIGPTDILGKPYGTQTQTVMVGWANNDVQYFEEALYPSTNGKGLARTSLHTVKIPIAEAWRQA